MRRIAGIILLTVASSLVMAESGSKTVKVFILAGQSNMVGHGKVEQGRNPKYSEESYDRKDRSTWKEVPGGQGSLRHLSTDPKTSSKYGHYLDSDGKWVVREDVFIHCNLNDTAEKGKLTVGFGKGPWIGPEFEFGNVVGDALEEQVLIIKAAWGGRDLAVDFRPPSSGSKDDQRNREVGAYYRKILEHVKAALAGFEADFPELKGFTPELAGFGWHQGYNDGVSAEYTAEYEANLANFIRDMRKDLKAEGLPFVVANTGLCGYTDKGNWAKLCQSQLNVGDPAKYPEFKGNVMSVETRGFGKPPEESPSHMGHHWYHHAEPHLMVGKAMGEAMVKLLKGE